MDIDPRRIAVAYDFDGTIADSYSCLPKVYRLLLEKIGVKPDHMLVESLLALEDVMDYYGVWDRRIWWETVISNHIKLEKIRPEEVSSLYWRLRTRYTTPVHGVENVLKTFKNMGVPLVLITGADDTVEGKVRRVKRNRLAGFFNKVIVYGRREVRDLREAIREAMEAYSGRLLFYIDDKACNLRRLYGAVDTGRVALINYYYRPPLPLALSWRCNIENIVFKTIYSHKEIIDIIRDLFH